MHHSKAMKGAGLRWLLLGRDVGKILGFAMPDKRADAALLAIDHAES